MPNARLEYEKWLAKLPRKEHAAELKQFLVDMMDWYEQSETEEIYINLYKCLYDCVLEENE